MLLAAVVADILTTLSCKWWAAFVVVVIVVRFHGTHLLRRCYCWLLECLVGRICVCLPILSSVHIECALLLELAKKRICGREDCNCCCSLLRLVAEAAGCAARVHASHGHCRHCYLHAAQCLGEMLPPGHENSAACDGGFAPPPGGSACGDVASRYRDTSTPAFVRHLALRRLSLYVLCCELVSEDKLHTSFLLLSATVRS